MLGSISVSVVSHGHGAILGELVRSLLEFPEIAKIDLTYNIPEYIYNDDDSRLVKTLNKKTAGYGENHNRAFARCKTPYFCVLNPDIRLNNNPFSNLLAHFSNENVALVGPKILGRDGFEEDSARREPTFQNLLLKALGRDDGTYSPIERGDVLHPDWLAGMFFLLRANAFAKIGGFDENFFLYYEDVDLCKRLRLSGHEICQDRRVCVMHDARRQSRKDWRYARWHLVSMARYLVRYRAWN